MTLPGQNVSVWKRDNSVKEVYRVKSMVRMPRNSHWLSSAIKGMRGLGGKSGLNTELRGATMSWTRHWRHTDGKECGS